MHAAAARRSGVPSPSTRALALLLAGLVSVAALALIAAGLSPRAIEALRNAPTRITWVPPAPPEPPPAQPEPSARPAETRPAPTPLPPPPPERRIESTTVPDAAPLPTPALAPDGAGVGTGDGEGSDNAGSGAEAPPPEAPRFVPAGWAKVPGTPELAPYNPPQARRDRVNGRVLLSCHVLRTRRLKDCRIVQERPRGYQFGRAALAAAQSFEVNPPMRGGLAIEDAWIEIPVAFNNRQPR